MSEIIQTFQKEKKYLTRLLFANFWEKIKKKTSWKSNYFEYEAQGNLIHKSQQNCDLLEFVYSSG